MDPPWYPDIKDILKYCNEAIQKHQQYGNAYDTGNNDSESEVHLTRSRDSLLEAIEYFSKYADKRLERLFRAKSDWTRVQHLNQMGFPAGSDDPFVVDFEKSFEKAGIFFSNVNGLASKIPILLRSNQRYIERGAFSSCMQQGASGSSQNSFVNVMNRANELHAKAINLIKSLVSLALVVVQQPTDPIKQKKNFETAVRLLKCGQFSDDVKAVVEISIVKYSQDHGVLCTNGSVINNQEYLAVCEEEPGKIDAKFTSIKIDSVEQTRRKAQTKAVEINYMLCYQIKDLRCQDIRPINVQTYSAPFLFTVHSTQECSASALAFWKIVLLKEGLYCDINDIKSTKILWSSFEKALNWYFCKTMKTDKGLLTDHKYNIGCKIFGHAPRLDDKVSYKMIAEKDPAGSKTTIWEWLYEAMQLLKKKPMKEAWEKGYIAGFIPKDNAVEMLRKSKNPSFLFRISESQLGAISMVVKRMNTTNETSQIDHILFDATQLQKVSFYGPIESDMMNGTDYFLVAYEMPEVSKADVLKVLKNGAKEEPQKVIEYCQWSLSFKLDESQNSNASNAKEEPATSPPQSPESSQTEHRIDSTSSVFNYWQPPSLLQLAGFGTCTCTCTCGAIVRQAEPIVSNIDSFLLSSRNNQLPMEDDAISYQMMNTPVYCGELYERYPSPDEAVDMDDI